jgi:hypothetical protein
MGILSGIQKKHQLKLMGRFMRIWFVNVLKMHHVKNMRNLTIHLGTDVEQEL